MRLAVAQVIANRPDSVVVVESRDPEHGEQRVAHDSLDASLVTLEDRPSGVEVASGESAGRLGIAFGVRGGREEHRDPLPTSAAWARFRRGRRSRNLLRFEVPGQLGVLGEDPELESFERRPGLDPYLLDQHLTCIAICLQCVRLPAGAVEREDQLGARPFPERVLGDETLQLRDELRLSSEREICIDPILERDEPPLFETPGLNGNGAFLRDVAEGHTAPKGQRVRKCVGARPGIGRGASIGDSEDELEDTLAEALACERTAVVDCRVDPAEHCFPMIPAGAAALDLVEYPAEDDRVRA